MSNKVAAPDASVDALGAGDSGASSIKSYVTMMSPILVWYWVTPFITGQIFPKQTEWVEQIVTNSTVVDEAALMDDPSLMQPEAPPMIEVELPITWLEYFCKLFISGCLMFLMLLLSVWAGQEGMLYVPDSPIKFIE